MTKTLDRSFGFYFKDKFIQGTVLLKDENQMDAYLFLDEKEFPCLNDLFTELNLNSDEEKKEFLTKLDSVLQLNKGN